MKKYHVVFRPLAEEDLANLYDYIAGRGGWKVAGDYIDRIEAACLSLASAPQRGTRRNDVSRDLRIIGFERRAVIAFRVRKSEVEILRIFYGGRDYERIMRELPEE